MVTIELPWPPTANNLYPTNRRTGRRYPSPKYKAWKKEADVAIIQARRVGPARVWGRFSVKLIFDARRCKSNTDLDNRIKATMDSLQRMMVIDNDSLADKIEAVWGDAEGVRVEIVPATSPLGVPA